MAGRPPSVTDEEILQAVRLTYGPATATEVAERVDMNRSGVNKRMVDLVERDLLNEKKVGARAKVYWLSENGKRELQSDPDDTGA